MPNFVTNVMEIIGDENDVRHVLDTISGIDDEGETCAIDFNKIIPMPESLNIESGSTTNRCIEITLSLANMALADKGVVVGSNNEFDDVIKKLNSERFSEYNCNLSAEQISVYTEELLRYEKEKLTCPDDIVKLGMQAINNVRQYGHKDWYDWAVANWGTKWGAYFTYLEGNVIEFDTAWSAPIPIFVKLVEMFPKVNFKIEWADEDMGVNTGYFNSKDGQMADYGFYDDLSHDAYQAYLNCKGDSECLYRDACGIIHRRDCDTCSLCG